MGIDVKQIKFLINFLSLNIILIFLGGCVDKETAQIVNSITQQSFKIFQHNISGVTCESVGPEIAINQNKATVVSGPITAVFRIINSTTNARITFTLTPEGSSTPIVLCSDVASPYCCDFDTRLFVNGIYNLSVFANTIIISASTIPLNIQNINAPFINPIVPNIVPSGGPVTVTGTADPNVQINIFRADNDSLLTTTTSTSGGNWITTFAAPIPQGTYTIYATANNSFVTSGRSNSQNFIVANT